jgi:hypothetical protein
MDVNYRQQGPKDMMQNMCYVTGSGDGWYLLMQTNKSVSARILL